MNSRYEFLSAPNMNHRQAPQLFVPLDLIMIPISYAKDQSKNMSTTWKTSFTCYLVYSRTQSTSAVIHSKILQAEAFVVVQSLSRDPENMQPYGGSRQNTGGFTSLSGDLPMELEHSDCATEQKSYVTKIQFYSFCFANRHDLTCKSML